MSYVTLLLGFAVLLGAGDLLVRGAVTLAERLGIPAMIIGLTVVACGTSAPELFISIGAALSGSGDIAIGNVVGSNIANILLVLGLPAMIQPIDTREDGIIRSVGFMISISIVFVALCFLAPLRLPHGILLLAIMAYFLWQSVRQARKARRRQHEEIDAIPHPHHPAVTAAFVIGGMVGLPVGAHLAVDSARDIALAWGVSEATIGLTIVALGTSLPEVAASVMAAIRRHAGIAVGNVIGSNIFNLLGVMGVTAAIIPVPVPPSLLQLDVWVMLATAILPLPFVFGESRIGRFAGFAFLIAYAAYIYAAFSSGA